MNVIVQNRRVGVIEDGIFTKNVKGSKHVLFSPLAWCLDKDSYDSVVKPNSSFIRIYDKETGTTWETTVADFDAKKKILDRGHGEQYYMLLKDWIKC